MLKSSFLDDLNGLIARARDREQEEHFAKREAEHESEQRATACREQQLVELAASSVVNFLKLEERRVAALESIASSCHRFTELFKYATDRLHTDAHQGLFRK